MVHRARERAEQDAAPNAEATLPHFEDPLPFRRRHFVPRRDVVIRARADDAERDTPDGDACDEIPVAALGDPSESGQPDRREDRDEQREPVHVQLHGAEVDDARVGRGEIAEHGLILPAGVGWRRRGSA